jgi:lysophospholipase L1-like esterase
MKNILIISFLFIGILGCKQESKTVALVGDSWGFFMCSDGSFSSAFKNLGLVNATPNSTCAVTTKIGMRAETWAGSTAEKATRLAIADASVQVIYLSLGGNDFLNHWKKSLTDSEEQAVFEEIKTNLQAVLQNLQAARPDVKILISGYDFPRFFANHPIQEYRVAYEQMESPTPQELNKAILRFSERVSELANEKSVFYIQHYGLMHYYLGNSEHGLAPFTTLNPAQISASDEPNHSGGNSDLQSDANAMLQIASVPDAFHLNSFGYEKIAEHAVSIYIKSWLQ